jgi:hypothetical protein
MTETNGSSVLEFGIWICFGFRILDFGFGVSPDIGPLLIYSRNLFFSHERTTMNSDLRRRTDSVLQRLTQLKDSL